MCGIGAAVVPARDATAARVSLEEALRQRGPDKVGSLEIPLSDDGGDAAPVLVLVATVLCMREGSAAFAQPAVDDDGNVLLWNGELYAADCSPDKTHLPPPAVLRELLQSGRGRDHEQEEQQTEQKQQGEGQTDTLMVMRALCVAARARPSDLVSGTASTEEGAPPSSPPPPLALRAAREALSAVVGPWAMIWWHAASKTLVYARDRLGRRSLLVRTTSAPCAEANNEVGGSCALWILSTATVATAAA